MCAQRASHLPPRMKTFSGRRNVQMKTSISSYRRTSSVRRTGESYDDDRFGASARAIMCVNCDNHNWSHISSWGLLSCPRQWPVSTLSFPCHTVACGFVCPDVPYPVLGPGPPTLIFLYKFNLCGQRRAEKQARVRVPQRHIWQGCWKALPTQKRNPWFMRFR